jgi:xanthine dehydrogenase accessory factor
VPAFFDQLKDHLARGPVALATVVASNGSTPRIAGARQLLAIDGTVIGTIGGGVMESRVIESARTGLHETRFVEVIEPAPRLLIVGAGHIGRALARQMIELRFVPTVHDDRREMMTRDSSGDGCELESSFESCVHKLRVWEGPRYAALVTRGFLQDVEALRRLANGGAVGWLDYLGILGSKRRIATVLAACRELGLPALSNDVLHAPIGIEIGAKTPEEIAVSIAAEMIRDLRCKNGTRGS